MPRWPKEPESDAVSEEVEEYASPADFEPPAEIAPPTKPAPPRQFASLPDNFGGIGAGDDVGDPDSLEEPEPEPDAEGYVRQPIEQPSYETGPSRLVGQRTYQTFTPEPRPLRDFTPEQLGQQIVSDQNKFTPMDRNLLCPYCGGRAGVFTRDRFTGEMRHQGCSPATQRQGVLGPPRSEPQTSAGRVPRVTTVGDAVREARDFEERQP